jgi:hypothetical protein
MKINSSGFSFFNELAARSQPYHLLSGTDFGNSISEKSVKNQHVQKQD